MAHGYCVGFFGTVCLDSTWISKGMFGIPGFSNDTECYYPLWACQSSAGISLLGTYSDFALHQKQKLSD